MLYGGAEFSRDADLVILAAEENLERLRNALDELQAECIAVPPFESVYLEMGLAIHFRCRHPEANNLRVDVMSKLHNVDDFSDLWDRRTTIEVGEETIELLSLPDLVQAKKTQRDKDWPMVARLLEANFFSNRDDPTDEQIDFWLRELRTPTLLIEVAQQYPDKCKQLVPHRSLLLLTETGDEEELQAALEEEEQLQRKADREYWTPLKQELQRLRNER